MDAFKDEEGKDRCDFDFSNAFDIQLAGTAEDLTKIVRIIRRNGWELISSRPRAGDAIWGAYFSKSGCPKVWLYFSSTVCKRVKVGTRMVEEDIYETRCTDQLSDAAVESSEPTPRQEKVVDEILNSSEGAPF